MTDSITTSPTLSRGDIRRRIHEHKAVIAVLLPDAHDARVQAEITALQTHLKTYQNLLYEADGTKAESSS